MDIFLWQQSLCSKDDGSFKMDMSYFEYNVGLTMTNKKLRTNFSNSKNPNIETDFLDIQIKSFQDFFQ